MAWHVSRIDAQSAIAAEAALEAFEAARGAGRSTVECYRTGVAAWRRARPDHAAEYAAKRAV
jgi:hypothetical protein